VRSWRGKCSEVSQIIGIEGLARKGGTRLSFLDIWENFRVLSQKKEIEKKKDESLAPQKKKNPREKGRGNFESRKKKRGCPTGWDELSR